MPHSDDLHAPGPFAKAGAVVTSDLASLIIDFASPLLQHCVDFSAREKAISYAILAWNLSLEQPQVREQEQRDIESMIEPDQREQIHSLLEFLIQRKETLYRDNRFFIVDYELNETDKGMEIRIDTKYLVKSQ